MNIYTTFYTFIEGDIYQNMLAELGPGSLQDFHQMLYYIHSDSEFQEGLKGQFGKGEASVGSKSYISQVL